jgi:DNA-binding HxlR family transcriptional regulator
MQRASFDTMDCSIARSVEVIGEWWTPLILRDAMRGVTRFEDFQRNLGIARNILTKRLDRLVVEGILARQTYDEARGRHHYRLTEKGKDLWAVLVMLRQWGDKWMVGEGNESVLLEHRTCGQHTTAHLVCDQCGEELQRRELRLVPGPGRSEPVE